MVGSCIPQPCQLVRAGMSHASLNLQTGGLLSERLLRLGQDEHELGDLPPQHEQVDGLGRSTELQTTFEKLLCLDLIVLPAENHCN